MVIASCSFLIIMVVVDVVGILIIMVVIDVVGILIVVVVCSWYSYPFPLILVSHLHAHILVLLLHLTSWLLIVHIHVELLPLHHWLLGHLKHLLLLSIVEVNLKISSLKIYWNVNISVMPLIHVFSFNVYFNSSTLLLSVNLSSFYTGENIDK